MTSQEIGDVMLMQHRLDKVLLARIARIDATFEDAPVRAWRSWMVMCANEREDLVNDLNKRGHDIPHRHLARCDGRRTS